MATLLMDRNVSITPMSLWIVSDKKELNINKIEYNTAEEAEPGPLS
jgi:hypothetical protein